MELTKPLVQLSKGYNCLLCRENIKYYGDPSSSLKSAENALKKVFEDIFQVFSKYMGWDPPPEYKYDFHKDQFPFCGGCNVILVRIYKIHEDIQSLEKQIEQFKLSASGRILDSECKIKATSTEEENRPSSSPNFKETANSCDSARFDERKVCFYYREYILKRYSVRVQLTSGDTKQLENYDLTVKSKAEQDSGNVDQDVGASDGSSSESSTTQDITSASNNQDEDSSKNFDEQCTPKFRRARKQSEASRIKNFNQDDADDGIMPSPESFVHSEYDPTDEQETLKAKRNRIRTAQHSTSSSVSSDEERCEDNHKNECEQEIPRARKQPFKYQTKQLGPNEYLMNDKLPFVYQNPGWKCSSCSTTALQRSTIISHMTSRRCSGLVSPKSVKELQHQGFKYDKLDDGQFECRRCPFAAPLTSSLKRHIVESHCRAHKQNNKAREYLMRKLVRRARLTQPRPDVFHVNNEHEFRLIDSEYSCSACSFRTGASSIAILHAFQKHDNQVLSSQIVAMQIHCVGPSKYKLGDFHFEAFPNEEYKCTTCCFVCPSLVSIKRHIRYEHAKDISKYVCDICGFSTFFKPKFKQHMSYHKDERPLFLCSTCGKSFKTQQGLKCHEEGVHPKSPIVKSHLCDVCGQKFRNNNILTKHMKRHQNVACDVCGKTYSALYLPNHLLSHNAEKKFECKQCGSKFQQYMSLFTHRKSCNGDKPYSCDVCGMKFTQSYSVTRHKNVAHNPAKTTRTCVRKGPAKQRRGQSLLTKKSLGASGDRRKNNVDYG